MNLESIPLTDRTIRALLIYQREPPVGPTFAGQYTPPTAVYRAVYTAIRAVLYDTFRLVPYKVHEETFLVSTAPNSMLYPGQGQFLIKRQGDQTFAYLEDRRIYP